MINILILCSGDGVRFGTKFKPLLLLDNRTFIEHCLENFIKHDSKILNYFFILRRDQDEKYNLLKFLKEKYPNIKNKLNVFLLEEKTSGPYQSLKIFCNKEKINNFIVCDCDHSIDIEPFFKLKLLSNEIVIPLWKIKLEDQKNWGKVLIQEEKIIDFYEKEIIDREGIYGMIGCYFFQNYNIIEQNNEYENISDFLKHNHHKIKIETVMIENAYFFGTPEMVKKTIIQRRNLESILFDIDGVLLEHKNHSDCLKENNKILGNCVEKINNLKKNKLIILISARPENTRQELINLLNNFNIYFDKLILGMNPGTRYLINDIKPSNIFTQQAICYNVIRNEGIDNLDFNQFINNNIKIIKIFKGGSFSKTCLIKINEKTKVRKYIIKNKDNTIHYEKLKRQCEDMKRFYFYNKLSPKILEETDNYYMYYFDMDYLENYSNLENFDDKIIKDSLSIIINDLKDNVYSIKKPKKNCKFWKDFLDEKIFPKFTIFEKECEIMNYLINFETVNINNRNYLGLRNILNNINLEYLEPKYLSPIHGDFTLENILYNKDTKEYKIIDMDGSKYLDNPSFDLGKLFQSLVSNFKEWKEDKFLIINKDLKKLYCKDNYFNYNFEEIDYIINLYSSILDLSKEDTKKIGIFCMSSYFIRFIPFMRKISDETAIYSMILSVVWLNKLL